MYCPPALGIIAAIENPKSAFSSFDCTVAIDPCPQADRRYYLHVQVFNLGGTGSSSTSFPICDLPILTAPGLPPVSCPASDTSLPAAGPPMDASAAVAAYGGLLAG